MNDIEEQSDSSNGSRPVQTIATEDDGRLLSARIADEIRRAVLSGEMRPGMRVRQELLAANFGASRIPVREALASSCENEGLVVIAPNRGAWIADVNSEESDRSVQDQGGRRAARDLRKRTEHDGRRHRVARCDGTRLEQVVTLEDYIQLDRAFHLRTYSRARMPQLLAMVERFWNTTQHFRRQFVKETFAKDGLPFSDPQHVLLMDAIRVRDADAARSLVRLHIRRTRLLIQTTDGGPSRGPFATRVRNARI